MENPLSQEQIDKINEISKLPPDKQQEQLQAFLKTLTPEQVAFLKQQQGGGECPFCAIGEGKIPSQKIYEDDTVFAVLDIKPAAKGHVIVAPKNHYGILGQMPDKEVGHLFVVANKIASKVFEAVKAEGTNIMVASGPAAGQVVGHVLVHVIPRNMDDGLNLQWEGKQLTEEDMKDVAEKLIGKVVIDTPVEKKEVVEELDGLGVLEDDDGEEKKKKKKKKEPTFDHDRELP